jgi:manganese/zinc/iron transport system permease protein
VIAPSFYSLDLPAMLTAVVCALACGLVGNFLVLRRQAMMGDAIAHAVLPGLAAGFLIAGTRDSGPMFLGALAAGLLAAGLVELLRRLGRVEPGAAMGVVFSAMFAVGLVLMALPEMRRVDLDADCVLNGQLEDIIWVGSAAAGTKTPAGFWSLADPAVLAAAPRELTTALLVLALVVGATGLLFKELRLASFDGALAAALGFRPGLLNAVLMALTAAAAVASFEAVGSILVVAMLICPAATARLLTDRLPAQVLVSALVAIVTAAGGYLLAAFGPARVGLENSVSAAGMMTVVAGVLLTLAIVLAPRHGVLSRALRRARVNVDIARDDLLAMLYRLEERGGHAVLTTPQTVDALAAAGSRWAARAALRSARRRGLVAPGADRVTLRLTDPGRDAARALVRSHRLWETYLVEELGLRPDHVHAPAERLEHVRIADVSDELSSRSPPTDPHGRPIPGP